MLFSGRFTDALQALNDWLYRAEPQLAEDVPVGGDKDVVNNLIDKHKVEMTGGQRDSSLLLLLTLAVLCFPRLSSLSKRNSGSEPDAFEP